MSTLLLRFAAPLQAWGVSSKFDRRDTERAPSKSAVIGMISAALGICRDDVKIERLSKSLSFGTRIDHEGILLRDYHTAKSIKSAYVTHRYYLSDAVFLVGLEGEDNLLLEIERALQAPYYPLYLGRRSCPPEGRLVIGIRHGVTLAESFVAEPKLPAYKRYEKSDETQLRVLLEVASNMPNTYLQKDQPLSFMQQNRMYGFRRVQESLVNPCSAATKMKPGLQTDHDPLAELEDASCT